MPFWGCCCGGGGGGGGDPPSGYCCGCDRGTTPDPGSGGVPSLNCTIQCPQMTFYTGCCDEYTQPVHGECIRDPHSTALNGNHVIPWVIGSGSYDPFDEPNCFGFGPYLWSITYSGVCAESPFMTEWTATINAACIWTVRRNSNIWVRGLAISIVCGFGSIRCDVGFQAASTSRLSDCRNGFVQSTYLPQINDIITGDPLPDGLVPQGLGGCNSGGGFPNNDFTFAITPS